MKIVLIRKWFTDKSTIGEIFLNNDQERTAVPFAFSLELPWKDNKHQISCIPEGTYVVKMLLSQHRRMRVPFVTNVPGRSSIEIHIANYPRDILGCIGVGFERGVDFIGHSTAAIMALYEHIYEAERKKEKVTIEIKKEEG